jgi:hypothetical protein
LLPVIKDGCYILSLSKKEEDYQKHPVAEPLEPKFASGYGMRMYAPDHDDHPPSFIKPASIYGRDRTS